MVTYEKAVFSELENDKYYNTRQVALMLGYKYEQTLYQRANSKTKKDIYAPDVLFGGKGFYSQKRVDEIMEYEKQNAQ